MAQKLEKQKTTRSIYYRWAIDNGATHEEAIEIDRRAKEDNRKRLEQRMKMTPEEELEADIKELRKAADICGWSKEEFNKRMAFVVELYERGKNDARQ